jgi:hypothetical protein
MAVACFALSLSTYTWALPVPGWVWEERHGGPTTEMLLLRSVSPVVEMRGRASQRQASESPDQTMHTARIIIFWLAFASSDSPTHADLDASYDVLAKPRATSLAAQ